MHVKTAFLHSRSSRLPKSPAARRGTHTFPASQSMLLPPSADRLDSAHKRNPEVPHSHLTGQILSSYCPNQYPDMPAAYCPTADIPFSFQASVSLLKFCLRRLIGKKWTRTERAFRRLIAISGFTLFLCFLARRTHPSRSDLAVRLPWRAPLPPKRSFTAARAAPQAIRSSGRSGLIISSGRRSRRSANTCTSVRLKVSGPPSKTTGFSSESPCARPPIVCLAIAWKEESAKSDFLPLI